MRPINNIVDATNYVMLEYGQPLHAFDFDTIGDATVIIRAARPGERFTTLDEEERKLEPPMLTIADSQDAIALAGVMGGQNTEVGDSTTNVLIESANFDATNSRNTATGLGMRTEASYRFERGIRQDLVPRALRRATALMLELAGAEWLPRGSSMSSPWSRRCRRSRLGRSTSGECLAPTFQPIR